MGREMDPQGMSQLPSEEMPSVEVLSGKIVKKVRLLTSMHLHFSRELAKPTTSNSLHDEYEDNRSLKEIITDPKINLLPKSVIAIRTYMTIETEAKTMHGVLFTTTDPFNFSPLIFLGGKETTYEEHMNFLTKNGEDAEKFSAMLDVFEMSRDFYWGGFKPSDPLIVARNNQVYSLRPSDIIAPEPKFPSKV